MPRSSLRKTDCLKLIDYLYSNMDSHGYVFKSMNEMKSSLGLTKNTFENSLQKLKDYNLVQHVRKGIYLIPVTKHLLVSHVLILYRKPYYEFAKNYVIDEAEALFKRLDSNQL